jgi:hypothetical protein
MKVFWIVLILFFIAIVAGMYPMAHKEKVCFDTAFEKTEDINYNVASRGTSHEQVCNQRSYVLMDLHDCLQAATAGSTLAKYTNSYINRFVSLIRPLTKSYGEQVDGHNLDCKDFRTYQLE